MVRVSLVDGPFQNIPAVAHCTGLEIVSGNWKGRAEVHFSIGSNRETCMATGALDESVCRATDLLDWGGSPSGDHFLVNRDFSLRREPVGQGGDVAGHHRSDVKTVLELAS